MFTPSTSKNDPLGFNQVGGLYEGSLPQNSLKPKKSLLDLIKSLLSFISHLFSSPKPMTERTVQMPTESPKVSDLGTLLKDNRTFNAYFQVNPFSPNQLQNSSQKFDIPEEVLDQLPPVK